MKRVRFDPALPTVDGAGRMSEGLPKLTQKQLDAAIRKAKGRHAVEQMISDTPGWQDYLLDDRRVLRVYKYTGTVIEVPIIVD